MRPLATWLVIGALALIGLFAARDALRGDDAPASAPPTTTLARQRRPPPAEEPRIENRARLAAELRALGAEGVLYLTDANCRRFLLRLPSLEWTPQGLPGPLCPDATVVDERFGLEASQVDADLIEVRSEDWSLRFQGTAPAFRPEGRLTFIRAGRLYEWTVQCPPAAERVIFRGFRALARCPRVVQSAPTELQEVVWLDGNDFAAVAGPDLTPRLIVARGGRTRRLFLSVGSRMGALQASPGGRYVAARVDEDLVLFDTRGTGALRLPGFGPEALAITWSRDDRLGAVATRSFIRVFPSARPALAVSIPVSAVTLEWR
jgi:hypothetical protein